ncbi:MAG TPA: signal peptidase I [Actinomycetota bacterium]|nr:signal peptidase I [Actinomycetota bacterium]
MQAPPVAPSPASGPVPGDPDASHAGPESAPEDEKPTGKKQGSFFKELPILILIAFGLALLIKSFLIQAFYIPSESMVPTLNVGDRVLVNKVVYKMREPRRGEVIVFVGERFQENRSFLQRVRDALTSGFGGKQGPERDFIKRIIGLPGETVEGVGGRVIVTPAGGGASFALDEPYLAQPMTQSFSAVTVPKGSYFVMGDNRGNSSDSRGALGSIKKGEIVGKAFVRVWPLSRFRRLTRPGYAEGAAIALPALWMHHRRRRDAA